MQINHNSVGDQMERGILSLVSTRSQQLSTQWAAWIRLDIWINLVREANSSLAALWLHTAARAPVLGLATGFLCVREPLWIEFLTNLSTWSGNIQQLHGTFHLQRMQFNEKQYENKSQTVLNGTNKEEIYEDVSWDKTKLPIPSRASSSCSHLGADS